MSEWNWLHPVGLFYESHRRRRIPPPDESIVCVEFYFAKIKNVSAARLAHAEKIRFCKCIDDHFPDDWLSDATNVTHLILEKLHNLLQLPALDRLPTLRSVHLIECNKLLMPPLPPHVSTLHVERCASFSDLHCPPTLLDLHINATPITNLPLFTHLEKLVLKNTAVEAIPDSLFQLATLARLRLTNNSKLASLPADASGLTGLHTFHLIGSPLVTHLSDGLFSLPQLEELVSSNCPSLRRLYTTEDPSSGPPPPALSLANFVYCPLLESLPRCLFYSPVLSSLHLTGSPKLAPLPPGCWGCFNLNLLLVSKDVALTPRQVLSLWQYHGCHTWPWRTKSCQLLQALKYRNRMFRERRDTLYVLLLWNARLPAGRQRLPPELVSILLHEHVAPLVI